MAVVRPYYHIYICMYCLSANDTHTSEVPVYLSKSIIASGDSWVSLICEGSQYV